MTSIVFILLVVPLAVLALAFAVLLGLLVRGAVLHSKPGSFPAWLLIEGKWVRGVGIYGRSNLEWRRSYSLRMNSDLVLSRRGLDLAEVPTVWQGSGFVVLGLLNVEGGFTFALRPGDASGLVAWIDSAPPGE